MAPLFYQLISQWVLVVHIVSETHLTNFINFDQL